ncbi:MAG: 4-hydroxythreonine-4-phosphate dehydrogenase PdxA [Bacteroidales bacterium]|nr:4-hydroxythreonine-4-phosphate dehydrogenase PdxA [Bacteroidales bacterium]MDZ4203531.1 4-hydroxythreonine-4-phosphate dehydrogenase PdxA [Bacteroidales bacterium]
MNKIIDEDYKIKVGITTGDTNGIGYEIIIKALADQRMTEICTPIVYGSSKAASYHRKTLNISDFNFNIIRKADQANPKKPNIVNLLEQEIKIDLGQDTVVGGEMALLSLEAAVDDLRKGQIDVLVTAPINKHSIRQAGFHFQGHTEYLANRFGSDDYLMLMISRNLRIGVITGHIPLHEVPSSLSASLISKKVKILHQSLIQDFAIPKPKIALLGLNPHAGDRGVIGTDEQTLIEPVIKTLFDEGLLVFGPYPADGFFGLGTYRQFDGVLAMYHDQGMLPFKTLSFDTGVNFTAGLPIVRTSPAHGTAYEIAGKDQASPDAFREALYFACDILRNRAQYNELISNPLGSDPAMRGGQTES